MLRLLLKDSVIYTIPTFLSRGVSVLLVPIYSRALNPADYGSLDLLLGFAAIINLSIALEISQGVARHYPIAVSVDQKIAIASSGLWFTVICYSLFLVSCFWWHEQLAYRILSQKNQGMAFLVGVIFIWINGVFYFTQNQLRWEQKRNNYAVAAIVSTLVTALGSVLLSYGLKMGLTGVLIGMALGNASGFCLGIWYCRKSFRLMLDLKKTIEMLRFSAPLVLLGISAWSTSYCDRLMIQRFLTIDDVGIYGMGYRLSSLVSLTFSGFQAALGPMIYIYHQNTDTPKKISRTFRLYVSIASMFVLFISVNSAILLQLFAPPDYRSSASLTPFIATGLVIGNLYMFFPGLLISKKSMPLAIINLAGAGLNVALNYILIPWVGLKGAGIAGVLSQLVAFIATVTVSNKYYLIPIKWYSIVTLFIVNALIVWYGSKAMSENGNILIVNLGVLGFLGMVIYGLGLVQKEDIKGVFLVVTRQFKNQHRFSKT
jgi:O-antigen/teichoic acid export membrane protein